MAHSERPQWDKEDRKPNHPPDKGGTKSSSREALNHVCIPETSQCQTKYNKGCKATEEFAFWTRIWRERNEDFKEIKKEENKGKSIHSMKLE